MIRILPGKPSGNGTGSVIYRLPAGRGRIVTVKLPAIGAPKYQKAGSIRRNKLKAESKNEGMNKEELLTLLSVLPNNAELLVDIGDRYAEIKDIKLEYSQRTDERKPYVIINIYR